jgi:hypothetical protein
MTLQQFLIVFAAMVTFGTLCSSGWFFITRGRWTTLPDGKKIAEGKIFKHWYLYWNKQRKTKKIVQYKHAQLRMLATRLMPEIERRLTKKNENARMAVTTTAINLYGYTILTPEDIEQLQKEHNVIIMHVGLNSIELMAELDDYVFPEWVRDPLANCATCFSSVYGSLFYWLFTIQAPPLFRWSAMPDFTAIFFWIVFCFSLAVLNTALAKKYN